ncbi:MAG: argininosuccinate lyase [Bryobacteraceae bacterium]
MKPSEKFPAPIYRDTVLAINFEDAKKYFLAPLLEIHYAHTLMLEKQGILTASEAATLVHALDGLDLDRIQRSIYDGTYEDLFFFVEELLVDSAGEVAGKMHTARSRNDIALTLYRMQVRREMLSTAEAVIAVREALLDLADAHVDTVMPAYTHTQPAQPTTLAHYLLAAIEFLGRDMARIGECFPRVNQNPLGSCAITTTGFPIDRYETARLLGFEGLQVNSYGGIAAIDYVTEAASVVAVAMVNLGKLIQDMLLWSTREFGFLRLSDAYVQSSSIMPQKRNPVALEHARILASRALAEAQSVLTCAHNTPFGDINDSEDDLQPLVFTMFADAKRALLLFAGAMSKAEVDRDELRRRAGTAFLTVTELADTLVRSEGVSFREAHHLVAQTVVACGPDDAIDTIAANVMRLAPEVLGRPLRLNEGDVREALDPVEFVRRRSIVGGPAPDAVLPELAKAHEEQRAAISWIAAKNKLMDVYPRWIREGVDRLVS